MPTSDLEFGQVALRTGPLMAGSCNFEIRVVGRGGHAAMPHLAVDPIYVGSQIVTALQSLVSRQTDPVDALVLTITKFHAGNALNIIPPVAELAGTIRSLSPRLLEAVPGRMIALCEGIAAGLGARAEVTLLPGYPVTVNDARAAEYLAGVARTVVPPAGVFPAVPPVLGSEDFSYYLLQRPGAFYFVGTRPPAVPSLPSLHHPQYDFNDDILPLLIRLHVETARQFAARWHRGG